MIETNCYASQYLTSITLTPHARACKWTLITVEELETFFGLILLTGIMGKKGRIADYWRTKPPLQTPFFNQTMPRDRFQLISSFLYFNNNDAMPSECTDKLYKIRPIFKTLIEKWWEMHAVGEHMTKACCNGEDSPFAYIIKISQLNIASRLTYWLTLHQATAETWTFIIVKESQ